MSSSFNRVIIAGNLTRDPQVRFTQGGTAVAEIGLAINRSWFDKASNSRKEETLFCDVTLWNRDAENAETYLRKGSSVLIEGRLQLDQWEDRETGEKRSKLKVVAESVQYLGGKPSGEKRERQPAGVASGSDQPEGIPDDEVPF